MKLTNKSSSNEATKAALYQFLKNAYNTERVQYYLDATSISPSDLCGLKQQGDTIARGIFYNGIGRMYDPGNSSGILASEDIIKNSARCDEVNGKQAKAAAVGGDSQSRGPQPARPSQNIQNTPPINSGSISATVYKKGDIDAKAKEAQCYFSPAREYSLTKAAGELMFFDELIFRDKCPPNPTDTEIVAKVGSNSVNLKSIRIVRLKNTQNGIKNYMIAAGKVVEVAGSASKLSLTRDQRKKFLEDVHSAAYSIILGAFRLAYEPRSPDGTPPMVLTTTANNPYYSLSGRDYSKALLDLKRAGDYGLVAAAAAATTDMDPSDTVPVVITHDRMAVMYALYSGVACMYVLNLKLKSEGRTGRFAKLFNYDQDSLAATMPSFSERGARPRTAFGGAFAIGGPARAAAARPVTRMSSRFAPVAAPAARPSTAPARPSESARKFAPARAPADRQNAPPRLAVRAEPPEFAEAPDGAVAPDPEFAKYAKKRFPPFFAFADMLAKLARGNPDSAELLSPINMLTYSFLHHYLLDEEE